jgi:hypothetical protein
MTKHDDLIHCLCEASEGSAELSAEVWTALTKGDPKPNNLHAEIMRAVLTTSLSAAWEEAERRWFFLCLEGPTSPNGRYDVSITTGLKDQHFGNGATPALALCAALLAAEGER